jgi:ferredoxin-thioredoxin reductase catalytic subunit
MLSRKTKCNIHLFGRATARAVVTAQTQVGAQICPCGICGKENGNGTDFSRSYSVLPCQYNSTATPFLGLFM